MKRWCIQKEGEGDKNWLIIHEVGKLVVETICCPLASDIYVKKMKQRWPQI
jgi:hypothetical protein